MPIFQRSESTVRCFRADIGFCRVEKRSGSLPGGVGWECGVCLKNGMCVCCMYTCVFIQLYSSQAKCVHMHICMYICVHTDIYIYMLTQIVD